MGAANQVQYEGTNNLTYFLLLFLLFITTESESAHTIDCMLDTTNVTTPIGSTLGAEDFSPSPTPESASKMMFPRDKGQDDSSPSVEQFQTLFSKGQTYIYIITSMPGDSSSFPHATQTDYTKTETLYTSSQPTNASPVGQSVASTTQPPSLFPIDYNDPPNIDPSDDNGDGPFDGMGRGVKEGVIVLILMGVAAIVFASVWFCCGGKKRWAKRKAARREATGLPLHSITSQSQEQSREPPQPVTQPVAQPVEDLPPPSYEEVVPAQHQRLAGGLPLRDEEEDGMVVDGKTPLSEIPFEDVVLDHSPTGSSSSASSANQAFSARHHNQYGDTRGHSNS